MIRQPTPLDSQLAWHRAAMAGPVDRHDGEPECGWYKRKAVKGGPWIPVRVWLHQVVDEETGELTEPEVICASNLNNAIDPYRYWLMLRPISHDEYDDLVRMHRDLTVMAATHDPIDISKTPIGPQRNLR